MSDKKQIKFVAEHKKEPKATRLSPFAEVNGYGDAISFGVREENGDKWYLLVLTDDGELIRTGCVPNHIGLKLDEDGRVEFANE